MNYFGKALRAAILIGLKPSDFWNLSLKEWRTIISINDNFGSAELIDLEKLFGEQNEQ